MTAPASPIELPQLPEQSAVRVWTKNGKFTRGAAVCDAIYEKYKDDYNAECAHEGAQECAAAIHKG